MGATCDLVGVDDGGETVRNDDCCAPLTEALQGQLHQPLTLVVQSRSGLVAQQNLRSTRPAEVYQRNQAPSTSGNKSATPMANKVLQREWLML